MKIGELTVTGDDVAGWKAKVVRVVTRVRRRPHWSTRYAQVCPDHVGCPLESDSHRGCQWRCGASAERYEMRIHGAVAAAKERLNRSDRHIGKHRGGKGAVFENSRRRAQPVLDSSGPFSEQALTP